MTSGPRRGGIPAATNSTDSALAYGCFDDSRYWPASVSPAVRNAPRAHRFREQAAMRCRVQTGVGNCSSARSRIVMHGMMLYDFGFAASTRPPAPRRYHAAQQMFSSDNVSYGVRGSSAGTSPRAFFATSVGNVSKCRPSCHNAIPSSCRRDSDVRPARQSQRSVGGFPVVAAIRAAPVAHPPGRDRAIRCR